MAKDLNASSKKMDVTYWIKLAIVLAIMYFFRFIPPFGSITPMGMTILGIFIGTLFGWCFCDPIWPSFLCIVMLGLSGFNSMSNIFTNVISTPANITIMLTMIFGGIILCTGISDWIAKWVASRTWLNGKPYLISAAIIATMFLFGAFCGVALMLLLWQVVYAIADDVGYTRDNNRWPTIMTFCIFINVAIGNYTSWGAAPVAVFGLAQSADPSIVLEAWPYMLVAFIISGLMVGLTAVALFVIFKPDVTALKNAKLKEAPQITKQQKFGLFLIVWLLVFMVVPSMLPASWPVIAWLRQFGTNGTLIFAILLALLIKIDGEPVCNINLAASKGIQWGPVFMAGTAFTVASALTTAETGVSATISQMFTPVLSGLSPFIFMAVCVIITVLLTNLINNVVVAAIFITILYSVKDVVGIKAFPMIIMLTYSTYLAVLLPSANPITALTFSSSDRIKASDMYRYAPVAMVVGSVILILIGWPLANAFFG